MKRPRRRSAWAPTLLAVVALVVVSALARAEPTEPTEPPPEAGEGDWTVERADSLDAGWVETTFAATGRDGARPRSRERVRFRGSGAEGAFRSGDDALRGGRLAWPFACGALHVGGIAPRWARGLVLGSGAQPWSAEADDRGEAAAYRGHAADGAAYRSTAGALELLAARYVPCTLAGARVRRGPGALGLVATRRAAQASAGLAFEGGEIELAAGSRRRWRAEFSVRRTLGASRVALRARGGAQAFRSLAEPRRAGPALLAAMQCDRRSRELGVRGQLAWWRYAPGAAGAFASLEVSRTMVQHAAVVMGFDEQHGTRRDPALVSAAAGSDGMRQGGWCAWRGRWEGRALELRHELQGGRAFARRALRRALVARGETPLPYGAAFSWTHGVWSTRTGESLYLSEDDGDRLTLARATGLGRRTRVELVAPFAGGRARAGVQWTETPTRSGRPAWTLEWTRRMRP